MTLDELLDIDEFLEIRYSVEKEQMKEEERKQRMSNGRGR